MIFEPETYFCNLKDKESMLKISGYNSCFRRGILICHNLLFAFVIGSYYETLRETSTSLLGFIITEEEKNCYIALKRILDELI